MSERRPKRRWYQFSLRSLFIVMTLFAVWLGVKTHAARQQRQAVQAIEKLGGYLIYDYQDHDGRGEPPGPAWLRRLIGEEYFVTVTGVILSNPQVTDADLEDLERLPNLQEFGLWGSQVTDAGVRHLRGLTNLRKVFLMNTRLTDDAIDHLKRLTRLESLWLCGTQVTDRGLEHLQGLRNLEMLDLSRTRVTDAGLEHLKSLTNLRSVEIQGTKVTYSGTRRLHHALPNVSLGR